MENLFGIFGATATNESNGSTVPKTKSSNPQGVEFLDLSEGSSQTAPEASPQEEKTQSESLVFFDETPAQAQQESPISTEVTSSDTGVNINPQSLGIFSDVFQSSEGEAPKNESDLIPESQAEVPEIKLEFETPSQDSSPLSLVETSSPSSPVEPQDPFAQAIADAMEIFTRVDDQISTQISYQEGVISHHKDVIAKSQEEIEKAEACIHQLTTGQKKTGDILTNLQTALGETSKEELSEVQEAQETQDNK